jgi:acetolactate synthase I/III small subunit
MTKHAAPPWRAGQVNAPQDGERSHILVLFADDQHGALDRIVGLLRRRRSNMQTFAIGRSEIPNVVRITVVMNDSEVGVEQLVEQLRKIVDVRHIVNLSYAQAVARELALIKVNSTASQQSEIIELGALYGAHAVDVDQETVTLEVTGTADKVEKLVDQLQSYGIREVARTGCVAMTRGAGEIIKE